MEKKYYIASLALFLVLALFFTRGSITSGGYYSYIDRVAYVDMTGFKGCFFCPYNIDAAKRITLHWIFFLMDNEQLDRIRFAALAFISMASTYHVVLKLMENGGYDAGGLRKHAIAFTAAFFYMVNPLSIEHFGALYPEVSYSVFPLAFYCAYMALSAEGPKYPLCLALLFTFLVSLVVHNAMYIGIMLVLTGTVLFVLKKTTVRLAFRNMAVFLAASAMLCLFILLPVAYIYANGGTLGYIGENSLNYAAKVAEKATMPGILLLDIKLFTWPLLGYKYISADAYYVGMVLIAAAAFVACIYRPGPLALTAGAAYLVFSFLANGLNSPAGGIYEWAFLNLPLGWLLRASPKFTFVLPLFFALMLAHFLALVSRRGNGWLAASAAMIMLAMGIFAWPVWTGDMGGGIKKFPAPPDLMDAIGIMKQDAGTAARVAWCGDYIQSSPLDVVVRGSDDALSGRYLLDSPNPQMTITKLAQAFGIKYVLLDRNSRDAWYDFRYAEDVIPKLGSRFEPLVNGTKFVLFMVNNDTPREMYIPKAVLLSYAGYPAVPAIYQQMRTGRDAALIFGDTSPDIAEAVGKETDVVIFGPQYVPVLRLDKGGIISFEDAISQKEGAWKEIDFSLDANRGKKLRIMQSTGIGFTGRDFGSRLVIANGSAFRAPDNSTAPLFSYARKPGTDGNALKWNASAGVMEIDAGNITALPAPTLLVVSGAVDYNGTAPLMVDAYFYDSAGAWIGKKTVVEETGTSRFSGVVAIPPGAAHVRLVIISTGKERGAKLLLDELTIRSVEPDQTVLELVFDVGESGNYTLFLRLLESREGGTIRTSVDDREWKNVRTMSDVQGFGWSAIYDGFLEKGAHTLRLDNVDGLNFVNIGYLAKKEDVPDSAYLKGKGIMYVYEGEGDFERGNAAIVGGKNYTGGRAARISAVSALTSTLHIYDERLYYAEAEGSNVTVSIDGAKVEAGGMQLETGQHVLRISANRSTGLLDYLLIYDEKAKAAIDGLRNGTLPEKGEVDYSRNGVNDYSVTARTFAPALLATTRGYDRGFIAETDAGDILPVPLFGLASSYPLENPGEYSMRIYYGLQQWFDTGIILSAISAIGIGAYLAWGWKRG